MVLRKLPMVSQTPLNGSFEKFAHSTLQKWHVPGVAIGVVDGDHTWAEGYGISSFPSTPVTPSTLFYAGSTTKAFTAAILAQLVADNDKYPHIQWTTPVSQLIREDFVLADEHATQHTTLEDILSHRTGLPRHDQAYGNNNMSRDIAVREIVRSLRHLPLTAEPRTRFQYCNLMFVVASHVIQSVTGEWLGDLLAKRIWGPLGMEATFFSLEDAQAADEELAKGYEYPYSNDDEDEGGDKEFKEVEWMPLNEVSGAGSVITNVLDYAKWAHSLLYESPPLSSEVHKAIWEPRTLLPTDAEGPFTGPVAYALGWTTGVYQGYQFYEHTGGMNAFGAELILFPELKYAVTILGNTAITSNFAAKKLAFRLIDEKIGVPTVKRFDWDAYNTRMINRIKSKAQNAITNFYPSLPSPRLPPTLPLSAYAGTYTHPGYQSLTITSNPSSSPQSPETLHADRSYTTWSEPNLTFSHVSGNYFIIRSEHEGDLGAYVPNVYPAEFVVGSDGKPEKLGIGYEEEMGKDGRIWFDRVL